MNKSKINKDKKEMLTLSPKIISNEMNEKYIKKLDELLNLKNCKNIALIGNYGSGKSSIIKTFLDEKKEYNDKSLTVTIGSYIVDDDVVSEQEDNKISTKEQKLVNRVEESILKQIIYRKKFSKFPKSSLIRYDKETWHKKIFLTFIILYVIWFVVYYLYKYYNKSILSFGKLYNFFGLNGIVMLLILMFFVFKIVILVVNKIRINKIKVKDCELELHHDTNSLFSRYLSEIVYYFQITKYDLIIFEDLDRFPPDVALKVIQELKELNTILNTSYGIKKIVFVYAIKDNLFEKVEDKNKFYDYNLSVLPISTAFNSELNLIGLLKDQNVYNDLSAKVIGVVSKYIFDMRTLINIVNDYCLFKEVTNTKNYDRLFAMVVFKNYYYREYNWMFSDIKKDVIKNTFITCEEKREELLSDLDKQKNEILESIDKIKNEILDNSRQLKELLLVHNIYANESISYNVDYYYLNTSEQYPITKFLSDDFDINLLKDNSFSLRKSSGNIISEVEVFKEFGSKEEFLERYNNLNNEDRILQLETELKKINTQKGEIKTKGTNEVFQQYFIKNELKLSSDNNLLYDLIKENFITQDYMDYITSPVVFKNQNNSESLMYSDSEFLMNVRQQKYSFDIKLTGFQTILDLLKDDFDSPYVLNYDLFNYLLDNKLDLYIDEMISQYEVIDNKKLIFLINFFKKYPDKINYIFNKLKLKKYDIWEAFTSNYDALSDEDGKYLLTNILFQIDYIECIRDIDSLRKFIEDKFISGNDNINELFENQNVRQNILHITPRIKEIMIFNENNYDFIYKNNLYSFSIKNICRIIGKEEINFTELQLDSKNYLLYEYIKENLKIFCEEYYINKQVKFDIPDLINCIINDKTIKISIKKIVYEREIFKLRSIDNVEKELYQLLVIYDHLNVSWKNIIDLYKEIDTNLLFEYTNKNLSKLLNRVIPAENENKKKSFFKKHILYLIKIDLKNTESIIQLSNPLYEEIYDLDAEQLQLLIKYNCLMFNKNIYKFICKILSKEERYKYILNGFNSTKTLTEILNLFSFEDLEMLLYADDLDNNQKIELLYGIYKKEKRKDSSEAIEKFINRLKITFKENIIYEIFNNQTIYNAILRKIKQREIFKIFIVEEDKIKFKL